MRSSSARAVLFVLATLVVERPVHADGNVEFPTNLARGMVLEKSNQTSQIFVRRAGVQAPLLRVATFGAELNPQATEVELLADSCWYFGEPLVTRFSLDMLEARLENAAALKLHRARRYAEAVPGFRKALRLDPSYLLAALNLASALSQNAQPAEAVAALEPFLRQQLPRVYLAMLQDDELLPLLQLPALQALRGTPPGTSLLKEREPRWLAYSARHGLLAVLDAHSGLVVSSLRSGQRVAQLAMGSEVFSYSCEGCALDKSAALARAAARADFAQKLPLANRFLAELGFNPVTQREAGKTPCSFVGREQEQSAASTFCLPRSGLKFGLADAGLVLVGKGKNLTLPLAAWADSISAATYLPQLGAVVYYWSKVHGSTECGRQKGTEVVLLANGTKPAPDQPMPR